MSDWRADLTFSDRVDVVKKLQAACIDATTKSDGRKFETKVYREAKSRADYDQLVASELQRLQNLSSHATIDHEGEDSVEDVLPPGGEDIGSYHQAHHFKDGLFSTIFKARGKNAGIFALKVTHSSTMSAPHDVHREARLLLKAASENVVTLLETFELSGARFVLAFPFVPYDLQQLLSQRRLSEQQKKSCLRDLMKGLHHLHGLGIIHRDIKPSNILLKTPSGPALIADFGIAWCSGDPGSEPSDQKILDVGTTSYRPPELLFGNQSYNESLDMWAAGCVAAQVIELGNQTLFDAGDLGSELALIKSIFETLGTPNLGMWSEAAGFSDWGKMSFHEYPGKSWTDILPTASADARDLVRSLITYESGNRLTALEALDHPYLKSET